MKENRYKGVNFCLRCGARLEITADRENKIRPRCPECNWTFYKNPIPASACVILNENNELVVIKRKFAPNPGEWALPSGYIEIDQKPEEAAVDEMYEETNLLGKVIKSLGYLTEYSPIYEKVISFGFLMQIEGGTLQAGDDAAEARYVSLDEIPDIAFPSHRFFIEKVKKIIDTKKG